MIPIGLLVGAVMLALGGGGGAIYLGILAGIMGLPPAIAAATSITACLDNGVLFLLSKGND